MSEDDIDILGPDAQASSSRVDRDRRAPRFSWTPAYETTFFRSLCASVQLGLRENSSFKAEAWERAAQALQEYHGAYPAKSHLINKSDNARKRFRLWRGLREDPDFAYNPVTRTVTATEDAWKTHLEREPLSRALRGRPFDHEEYMEILYPDVIGSGGAPKRIMKPRRRTDGLPADESEIPETGVLPSQPDLSSQPETSTVPGHTGQDSPGPAPSSSSILTPTASGTAVGGPQPKPTSTIPPPRTAPPQQSALTPPDEPSHQAKKRTLSITQCDETFGTTPPLLVTYSASSLLPISSPEKRQRTSSVGCSVAPIPASSGNLPCDTTASQTPPVTAMTRNSSQAPAQLGGLSSAAVRPSHVSKWCELALEQFFTDFADESMDLQIRIAENVLIHENKALIYCKMPWLSYADVAASGIKQTPEEAAAPQPVELVNNEPTSTASVVGVSTVPSDYLEQAETKAGRLEREAEAAKNKAQNAKKQTAKKARQTDSWIVEHFASLSDGSAGLLAFTNFAAVIGVSSYLGYKAWGLYERGQLNWEKAGVGIGILAGVGAAEAVFGRYLYKGKKGGS
ncbi:hypothetical protein E4U42_006208 [Claviceps africana]|uniref:Myb/SANT-like domain-containing protein n=1 Tax=Claviceps africana TaxID=83212 RepID=A0A8K0NJH1_9HYPO|nr:hypothetical protein E4U42_006208 [Claviceps africana]